MNSKELYSTIGLVLDIVGVILLFYWEPPKSKNDPENNMIINGDEKDLERFKNRIKVKRVLSRVALFLIIIGFVFQIVANVI